MPEPRTLKEWAMQCERGAHGFERDIPMIVICQECAYAYATQVRQEEQARLTVEVLSWHCPGCGMAPLTTKEHLASVLAATEQAAAIRAREP